VWAVDVNITGVRRNIFRILLKACGVDVSGDKQAICTYTFVR
jgi:hypothetical protein